MHARYLINGLPGEAVAADDRGLHFGDGLFETLAVRDGVCEFWDRHVQRLLDGCTRLGIVAPAAGLLAAEAHELCRGVRRAVLKIIVTRGSGGRGYRAPEAAAPTRILRLGEWPDYPAAHADEGVRVRLCAAVLGRNPALAGIKHLNRLEQVLARMEWDDPAIAEGLLTDADGHVVEGTFSNVFAVQDGALLTPQLDGCGVAGVLRAVVLDLAAAVGIACSQRPLRSATLAAADELFLTNSLIGIWPVRQFDGHGFAAPGPVTRALQGRLRQLRQTAI